MNTAEKKPRGMAAAKASAKEAAAQSKPVSECPYRRGGWRSIWLTAYEQHKQMDLFGGR